MSVSTSEQRGDDRLPDDSADDQPEQSPAVPVPPGTIGGPGTSETDGVPDPRRDAEPVDPILGRPDQPPQ